jgi:hypothetical protein
VSRRESVPLLGGHSWNRLLARAWIQEVSIKATGGYTRVSAKAQSFALDDALNRLTTEAFFAARVGELRRFAGLGHEDLAGTLGITVSLARRGWIFVRGRRQQTLGG